MALVPTVTGLDPTKQYIRANIVLTDEGVEVRNRNIQVKFNSNVGPTVQTTKQLTRKAQAIIDDYKAKQAIKETPEFSSVFGQIQSDLKV